MNIVMLLLGISVVLESVNVIICEVGWKKREEEIRYRLDVLEDKVRRIERSIIEDDGR